MMILGLCLSIRLVTLLPALVAIVPKDQLGRCYSLVLVFGEFGVVLLSFISGILRDWNGNYNMVINIFIIL